MESDGLDEGMTWDCSEYDVITRVKQIHRTPYFNRLKQFYLRLIRNNLYIGKNNSAGPSCFICAKHPEKRIPVMLTCEPVKLLTLTLIKILKTAGLLRLGDTIEMFLFTEYEFASVENFFLITLWDFVYKIRFDPEKYSMCMFTRYLKHKIDYFALVSLNLKLGCLLVSSVLQKYNYNAYYDK